jgi:hypothetical protein
LRQPLRGKVQKILHLVSVLMLPLVEQVVLKR